MVRGSVPMAWCLDILLLLTIRIQVEGWTWTASPMRSLRGRSWTIGTGAGTNTDNCSRRRLALIMRVSPNRPEQPEGKEEDWRDVRAKLLQQYYKSETLSQQQQQLQQEPPLTNSTPTTSDSNTNVATPTWNKWAYDSGSIVECGSLIVSHPVQDFGCGGLKQQYFHKCVVLVVKHDAHFTKGIVLNRCSRSILSNASLDNTGNNNATSTDTAWKMHFAGDVQGWNSPHPDYTCLHRLQSPKARELSLPVVKDIHHTTWQLAQLLVEQGEAKPEDFWLGCGYAGWWPQQLQQELERNNWFMVATDSESIVELLLDQSFQDDETGTSMWKHCMTLVDKDHIVEDYATQQSFEDVMLEEWIRYQATKSQQAKSKQEQLQQSNGMIIRPPDEKPEAPSIHVGTIYRASHPILLDEQVFHESLLLILKKDERGIVGAVLNRPSAKVATLQNTTLPLRYGGRYGLDSGGKQQEIWLHCGNEPLRNAKVGHPIVPNDTSSLVWQCTREDAETAVEIGLAKPSDFMVIMGLTLWEKNPPPEGFGVPLTKTNLEKDFSPVPKSKISRLWNELLLQEVLTESTLAKNLNHATKAYHMAWNRPGGQKEHDLGLADDALQRWIKMFLLKPNEKQ